MAEFEFDLAEEVEISKIYSRPKSDHSRDFPKQEIIRNITRKLLKSFKLDTTGKYYCSPAPLVRIRHHSEHYNPYGVSFETQAVNFESFQQDRNKLF